MNKLNLCRFVTQPPPHRRPSSIASKYARKKKRAKENCEAEEKLRDINNVQISSINNSLIDAFLILMISH